METPLPTQPDTPAEMKVKGVWQKTRYPNLIRYIPSGTYFGRLKADGKLIRRSLDTHVLEVAKLRLEIVPTEPVELGLVPPECPFALDGIIRRGIVRLVHRLASGVL